MSWGRHSLKMGGGYTWRTMDAQYSNPTNGDAHVLDGSYCF